MTGILGATEVDKTKEESAASSLKVEVAKRVALGGGWSVGAAIVFGAFELLHNDSKDAFPLLRSWGPWAIVTIIAIYAFYDLAKMFLNVGMRLAHAVEAVASAQQKAADKDDRQIQEMQTLTSYTAQQSERAYALISQLAEGQTKTNDKLDQLIDSMKPRTT